MDRTIETLGQIPLETMFNNLNRNVLNGLGWLARAVMGTPTLVTDVTCLAATPASLNVIVTPGQIFSLENVDASQFGSLGPDTAHQIVKQGLLVDTLTLAITPPGTVGFATNYLIQAAFSEFDAGSLTAPYYNPVTPAIAWSGPNGSGTPQFTSRVDRLLVTAKPGVAATAGTQTTPAPDAGYVGLFVVTVGQGATTVTAGNIAPYSPSFFSPVTLPGVPRGVQSGAWTFGQAAGTNDYTATLFSTAAYPFALTTGMKILINFANANTTTTPTLNVNGTGAKAITARAGGTVEPGVIAGYMPLIYDGTNWVATVTRTQLAGNRTFYLRPDGSDANDGSADTASGAFRTLAGALAAVRRRYDAVGYETTFQLAPGSYQGARFENFNGPIAVRGGAASTNNPTAYAIAEPAGVTSCVVCGNTPTSFENVMLDSTTGSACLSALRGSVVTAKNSAFRRQFNNSAATLLDIDGGDLRLLGDIQFIGAATGSTCTIDAAMAVGNGGLFRGGLSGSPTRFFYTNFAWVSGGCRVSSSGVANWVGTTMFSVVNVSGPRFTSKENAILNLFGGGASFLPGSTAGITDTASGGVTVL